MAISKTMKYLGINKNIRQDLYRRNINSLKFLKL